ncbi:MAG: hypothetical protein RSC93_00435 [Erysipelotrichaceae bacterium]
METYDPSKISFSFGNVDLNENFDPSKIKFSFGNSKTEEPCDNLMWYENNGTLKFNCKCSVDADNTKPLKFSLDCSDYYIKNCPQIWQEADGNNVNFDCKCSDFISTPTDFNFSVDCSNIKDINLSFNVEQGDEYTLSFDDSIYVNIEHGTELESEISLIKAELDFNIEHGFETSLNLRANRQYSFELGYGEDTNVGFRTYPIAYFTDELLIGSGVDYTLATFISYDVNAYYGHGLDNNLKYSSYVTIPVSIEFGTELNANLNTSKVFNSSSETGTGLDTNITFFETLKFDFNVEHGEDVKAEYDTYKIFAVDVKTGEDVVNVLTDAPNENFVFNYDHGEQLDFELATKYSLSINIENGEDVNYEIDLPFRYNIEVNIENGEDVNSDLYYGVAFIASVENGENIEFELATDSTLDFETEHGEDVNIEVTEGFIYKPIINIEQGEKLDTNIITSSSFDIRSEQGEQASFNMKSSDNFAMNIFMQYGTEFIGDIFYSQTIPIDVYHGQGVAYELDTRVAENPTLTYETGEQVELSLAHTYSFKFNIDHGDNLTLVKLDEKPNDYVYHGENLDFELSTTTTLSINCGYGEESKATIKYAESEPVGKFEISHGFDAYIKRLYVPFIPKFSVSFSLDFDVSNNNWMSFYHDLGLKSCCYDEQDLLNIDMATEPDYDVYYDTDYKERVEFDLRTSPTLSFTMNDGTEFKAVDESTYMTAEFFIGSDMRTKDIDYELYIELNVGNVVLEPTDITVEINRPADTIPQLRRVYSGEWVEFNMSYAQNLVTPHFYGEYMDVYLNTYEAWRIETGWGQEVWFELNVNYGWKNVTAEIGASVEGNFYADPYYFDHGDELFVSEFHTNYDVEMTNNGCLANKYVKQDENGFPIPDETGIVAIEGKEFMAYVEGRCF